MFKRKVITIGILLFLIVGTGRDLSLPKIAYGYSEQTYFIHQDNVGSVVAVTDQSGGVVTQNSYNPYGSVSTTYPLQPTTSLERAYTGQIADSSTNLDYYNARYYDPNLSRFISLDSQGANYSYVSGNPVSFGDPSGNMRDEGQTGGGDPFAGVAAGGETSGYQIPSSSTSYFNSLNKQNDNLLKMAMKGIYLNKDVPDNISAVTWSGELSDLLYSTVQDLPPVLMHDLNIKNVDSKDLPETAGARWDEKFNTIYIQGKYLYDRIVSRGTIAHEALHAYFDKSGVTRRIISTNSEGLRTFRDCNNAFYAFAEASQGQIKIGSDVEISQDFVDKVFVDFKDNPALAQTLKRDSGYTRRPTELFAYNGEQFLSMSKEKYVENFGQNLYDFWQKTLY
jgi:RHS repeat-associated protein